MFKSIRLKIARWLARDEMDELERWRTESAKLLKFYTGVPRALTLLAYLSSAAHGNPMFKDLEALSLAMMKLKEKLPPNKEDL